MEVASVPGTGMVVGERFDDPDAGEILLLHARSPQGHE
jgi:hypothetical protein